jgi:predicted nucleotidyltransferase component of viral defense system
MSKAELPAIRFHEDSDLFQESVRFTAAETAFAARLIEKDYFCTVLLAYLAVEAGNNLIFKGGTCLAKVHAELYRLSEDLDFAISMPVEAPRSERRKRAEGMKEALAALPNRLSSFRVVEPLKGANSSTQYVAVVAYTSLLSREEETIKIEVSLREPLLMAAVKGSARTLLLDPVTSNPLVPPVSVPCISKTEALAEKFRAAMSRREVAIRDFYDIDHAVRKGGLQPDATDLVKQVKRKLAVPGNEPVDVSAERLAALRKQIDAELRPVLREQDFAEFDLDRAFKTVVEMAKTPR